MKLIPYGKQSINQDDINLVVKTLKSDFLTQGPLIEKLEAALAQSCHAKYAVVVSSGTAALHAAYFALGLANGDDFITTPMTFAATANAGLYLGAKPIFVDVLAKDGNINPDLIESAITPQTKLISVVHYGGNPVNLAAVSKIAKKHHLFLVEDACHALGATYQYKNKIHHVGDGFFADATVLSFHPVKHITTGEGGAVLTNNRKVYDKAKMFRSHGIVKEKKLLQKKHQGDWYMEMQALGFNYRLTDIQCALGFSQIKRLTKFVARRRQIAASYNRLFKGNLFFETILPSENNYPSYHLYPILLNHSLLAKKQELVQTLRQRGVGTQVHYIPVYQHPYYQQLGFKKGLCPEAELFYQRELSIPMFYDLSDKEIKFVAKTILQTCSEYAQKK